MDIKKTDQIILFTLLEASRQDDPYDRDLGPIHLVKYVYLADLAYAEYHRGETYTGAPWKFHHYGPWALEVFQRIDPAVEDGRANKKTVSSPKLKDDFFRYSYADDNRYDDFFDSLPFEITGAIRKALQSFGNDTAELLHYVYRTRPMISAAPGEYLNFEPRKKTEKDPETDSHPPDTLTVKRKRLKKEAIEALKKKVAERRAGLAAGKGEWKEFTPPRYDDVYFEGVEWVESLAGAPVEETKGVLEIPKEFWKSSFRTDDDLS